MKFSQFLGLFKEGKVGAKSHMKNLIEMAMVDGHFDISEKGFLRKIANKYNVSSSQLKSIHNNPEVIEFELPKDDSKKFEQLYDLVNMMVADEFVDHEEIKLCGIFAQKFGYKEGKSRELVAAIVSNIEHGRSAKDTELRVAWLLI
jgi:uncharacterized tellurite resistance protein B-like protein